MPRITSDRLIRLFDEQGQSPWLDNLQRSYLTSGELAELVAGGVRGVTSNPSIFQKAIAGSDDYDEQFALELKTKTVDEAYWELVLSDIQGACDVLRPLWDASGANDGHVSVEVSPKLAHDTAATIAAAKSLWARVDRPNVLIKIPATIEGLPAIHAATAAGISVNVTLIFSLDRHDAVITAFQAGIADLIAGGGDPSNVRSVASFFVSRVDTEIDRRLDADGSPAALAARGKAAVAQIKLAFELSNERFATDAWAASEAAGAVSQRPLWASTSTKNPAYPPLLYVDAIIGRHTVNTIPEATLLAFADHGTVARTVDADLDDAKALWAQLPALGIDVEDVAAQLESEGVASFAKAFDELLQTLSDKAASLF